MKQFGFLMILSVLLLGTIACEKNATEVIVDTAAPQGNFLVNRKGTIVEQNSTGSKGTVNLGQDTKGTNFVMTSSDFTTVLATGTVTVYLSTSSNFKADPMKGNPDLKLIGIISKNGENYFKLTGPVETKFTHLILWCGSANIPFGVAELK